MKHMTSRAKWQELREPLFGGSKSNDVYTFGAEKKGATRMQCRCF